MAGSLGRMNQQQHARGILILLVVARHQIAVYLYELDDGAHKHEVYARWAEHRRSEGKNGLDQSGYLMAPVAFFHRRFNFLQRYPNGLADVVGYWAEGKIFGGAIVFDRGETEQEVCEFGALLVLIKITHRVRFSVQGHVDTWCLFKWTENTLSSQAGGVRLTHTLLLSNPDDHAPCPLPIRATLARRPRWDADQASAHYHIFRDKYERKITLDPPIRHSRLTGGDWPELADEIFLVNQANAERWRACG
ncbi:hypothetical protein B0T10DRAFT_587445 [Thelonectria olida]|uniref:Uncharacterized protein n=1 Tax=Thelonectria olida TaxID=1576542 RepID=A0A9P8WG78_9HYPO|nr:hypothetical protein B0T10DRAFT_587445 [Thelonectria olida]